MPAINPLRNTLLALIASLFGTLNVALADDCQMQISQPVVDYGTLNPDTLRAAAKTSVAANLDKHTIQVSVMCPEPRSMAIAFRGMPSGSEAYKLGDNGSFELTIKSAQLDGALVLLGTVSSPNEAPTNTAGSAKLIPGHYVVPVNGQQSSLGKVLSMSVEVSSSLLTEHLKVRDLAVLEGKGNFELQ